MAIIAKYKFDSSLCADYLPVFNSTFTGYTKSDVNNGDGTITRTISHDTLKPTSMRFGTTSGVTGREKSLLEVMECDTSNVTSMISMFQHCSLLTSLDLSSFDTSKVNNMFAMFQGCTLLASLNISSFKTSQVTNISKMFYGCYNLTSLDLSNFDTSRVTTMSYLFTNCSSLVSLNISSFNTSRVTEMNWMFSNCSKLTQLDLSSFDTSKVKLMDNMFNGCQSLTSLNVSNFDTSEVTSMVSMFQSCRLLTTLDLSNFNTSKVTNMVSMFFGCPKLTSLNISSFNTSQVIDMSNMFQYCSAFTSLDLSNFNTGKVTSMANMFNACNKLTSLDLSNFETNSVTNINAMFNYCSSLVSLDLSNFDTSSVTNMGNIFDGCPVLSHIGLLYATSTTINSLLPYLGTSVSRNIYYTDAPLNELTVQNNITYKEYKLSSSITFPYTLNKLPNGVADYIDVVNKVHVQMVGVEVLDGSDDESWILYSDRDYTDWTTYQWRCSLSNDGLCFAYQGEELKSICDKLSFGIVGGGTEEDYEHYRSNGSTICTYVYVWLNKAKASTVSELKQYLKTNTITILYELATPIYTPLTDEEIAQLPLTANADSYVNLSSKQLTPTLEFRMRASNRYQVDMLETGYYYLNAPVGNVKLGAANVDVAQMPCIIKVDNVGTGDSGYRLGLGNGVRESIINLTFGMYVDNNNGNTLVSPQDAYTPDYLSLEDYGLTTLFSLVSCEDMVAGSDGYGIIFVLFNEEKNLIRAFVSETGIVNEAIPAEAKYFKLSIRTRNSNNPKAKIANSTPLVLAKLPSHRIPTSFAQGMACKYDFGYWEGIKESAWRGIRLSGETGEGSLRSADNNIRYLNRLTYDSNIIEDEFDFATGKLTKRIGKFVLTKEMVDNLKEGTYGCDSGVSQHLYLFCKNTGLPYKKSEKTILASIPLGTNGSSYPSDKVAPICLNIYGKDLWLFSFRDYKDLVTKENKKEYLARYLENNPITIYYELEVPEISYVDVLSHTGKTRSGSTNMYTVYYISETYLQPQVKPSLLSYPTLLTPSTQYTVFHNRKNYDNSSKLLTIDLGGTQVVASGSRTVVTTPSTLSHSELRFIGGENTVEQVMVLHGDWTKDNKDIDYFEGIQHSIIGDKTLENLVGNPIRVDISTTKDIVSVNDAINDNKVHTKDGLFESVILKGNTLVNLLYTENIQTGEATNTSSMAGYDSSTSEFHFLTNNSYPFNYSYVSFQGKDGNGLGRNIKSNTTYTILWTYEKLSNENIANTRIQFGSSTSSYGSPSCSNLITTNITNRKVLFHSGDLDGIEGLKVKLGARMLNSVEDIEYKVKIVILEGDYTNIDIPYFEGMQSVKAPILTTRGKNLFDGTVIKSAIDVTTGEMSPSENSEWFATNYIDVKDIKSLYFQTGYMSNLNVVYMCFDENKNFIGHKGFYNSLTGIITPLNNTHYIRLRLPSDIDVSTTQIEQGTQPTSYEPHKSNILTVDEEVELRGIGDVKDELNLLTGELTQRIDEIVLNGSQSRDHNYNGVFDSVYRIGILHSEGKETVLGTQTIGCCDKLVSIFDWNGDYEHFYVGKSAIILFINKEKIGELNDENIKKYLQQNPITVQYQLATEVIKTVDLSSYGNWEKVVLDGSEDWSVHSRWSSGDFLATQVSIPNKLSGGLAFTDSKDFKGMSWKESSVDNMPSKECVRYDSSGLVLYVFIKKSRLANATADEFKQWLSNNPITVWYQTATHQDSTQVKQPLLFKDGYIQLSSGGLLPNAELTVPTTNKYQLDLDRLMYTVITKQGFTFNGNDYSASATGLNVIDVVDVVDNALYSDDENITVVQENANSYEDGVLTQFKGTKVFAKNFIDTTNSIKRSAMKMIEPLELQGIPGGATDTYDVISGVVTKRVNSLHIKDLAYRYSTINSDSYKKYVYSVYTYSSSILANRDKQYISNILPAKEMNVDSTERGFYFSSGNQLVVWQIGSEVDTLKQYLEENDFTVTYELTEPQIIKPNEMKPYVSTRPEKGSIESLDSKLQAEYLDYDNEQYILSPRMLGEGDTIRWEQGSQCYVFENDKEYIPLEDYREPFGFNLDAKDVEQYIENVEGAEVELGIPLKEKGVYERTFANHEDSVIYSTELDNIDEQRGTEVDYICGATWQNPNDLSDIRHVGTLRPDGQYDVNVVRSGDDEIRLLDGTTHINLDGSGLNPSEFELTYFNDGGAELGKYGDTSHTLEGTVKDSKLATGTVYGETLVNLVQMNGLTFVQKIDGAFENGAYNITNLKSNTKYLRIVYVDEMVNNSGGNVNTYDGIGGKQYGMYNLKVGINVQTITTGTISDNNYIFTMDKNLVGKVSYKARVVLLEYQDGLENKLIPYFEGVGSTIVNGFTTVGKNLLDLNAKDFDNKDVVGTVCSLHNGIFTIKGLSRGSGGRTSLGNGITFLFKKGKTYTLSIDVIENNATTVPLFYFSRYDNSSAYISTRANNNPGTITATEDVLAYIGYNVEKDFYYDCKVKVQIEYGTQATEFEPYQSETQYTLPTPITLNKVGDVADTFNVISRVETRKLEKIVFDDNVDYYVTTFNNTTKYYYVYTLDFDSVIIDNAHTDGDYIATVPYAKIGVTSGSESSKFDSLGDITFTSSNSGTKVKFIIEKSLLDNYGLESNTQNAKAYFRDNPVSVIITRKTPTTIQHTLIPSHQPVEYPTFILPQQLRSVPNGICDRLYWDENKGHYCIEKRINKFVIDDSYGWSKDQEDSTFVGFYGALNVDNLGYGQQYGIILSDFAKFTFNSNYITNKEKLTNVGIGYLKVFIRKDRLSEPTENGFKLYLKDNPITLYHPLNSNTPEIIDLPHLNHKLELPTQPNVSPIGYKVEHSKANPQLGLTIPYKVLNMPKQPTDLNFVMRDNQIGDYILTWSEIKEARQYNIILNDDVIATTKEPSYNTGEEIYGYILVEAQNELGENLSKELYVKTVPNAPAQLTVTHNPMTDSYDFDITFISTSAIADYYTIKYCVDDGDWVVHDIQATDIELDSKVLYQFSVFSIEDNIKVHATATNDIGTNDILPVATYYMSPTPQWTYRINSKEAFIRWIDNSPYDVKYKVRYSYLSEGVYKYAYFEGDTSEVGKMYELMLPLTEDDELTVSICIVSDKENLYCKPVKMSKSLDPNIVPPLNFKYRWLARGLIEFSWEDNYEVDVKYEYVLEHKLADADVWEAINEEIMAEDVAGIGTVYRLEYQLQDLEQIRVKVRMLWAMNETEWTETLATVFIPVEGNPPTWIKRTQTQEGLLVQWEAQAYVDSYHLYITDSEGTVLQHIETLDDFILLDIDYDNPIELHIYEKTRFSGGIESDPTDEMVFTPTSYRTTHLMNVYKPCAEEYEMEVATIQKGSKEVYVINDVTYTPNVKATGDVVASISSPFQISYHPLGIDVHQAGSKAYAPLDLSVRTLDVKNKYQFDIMTFERITDKYDMNFNVYTPSVMSYPITLEVSKVRIVCLGDSLTSGHPYYWAETGTGMVEASYPYQLSRRLKNQFEVINSGYGYFM